MDVPEDYAELNLYEVLDTTKDKSGPEIRKAYLRQALRTHPDKTGGDDTQFRKVAFAYSILSNESYRKRYDETGQLDFRKEAAISDLFSKMVRVEITEEMIEENRRAYQHSEEEKKDIYRYYEKHNGDFNLIFENVIHSTEDDMERFIDIIQAGINEGTLKKTKKFTTSTSKKNLTKRRSQALKEAKEVEQSRKELGIENEAGLAALIQKRQNQRSFGSLIDQLESKYAVSKKPRPSSRKRTAKSAP